MLATNPALPRLLLAALPLFLFGGSVIDRTLMTRRDHTPPHRYFSALAMLHRVTCEQSPDLQTFMVGVAQRDEWGQRYLFECTPRGFTLVSAGEDGRFDTADDTRSDR